MGEFISKQMRIFAGTSNRVKNYTIFLTKCRVASGNHHWSRNFDFSSHKLNQFEHLYINWLRLYSNVLCNLLLGRLRLHGVQFINKYRNFQNCWIFNATKQSWFWYANLPRYNVLLNTKCWKICNKLTRCPTQSEMFL